MAHIIPINDLRKTNEIVETCDDLIETQDVDNTIVSSEVEIFKGGELLDAKSVLAGLREKYFG